MGDLDHVQFDVFMLPLLDSTDTVVWEAQLGLKVDGGVPVRRAVRGLIVAKLLRAEVVTELLATLAPIKGRA